MHRFTLHLAALALLAWPLTAASMRTAEMSRSVDAGVDVTAACFPEAPSNLTADDGAHSGWVDLTWTDNSEPNDPCNEYYFEIWRASQPGESEYEFYDGAYQDTESYTDTGASGLNWACYKVRAVNGYGASAFTNEACWDV